jgi:hypothetical protein
MVILSSYWRKTHLFVVHWFIEDGTQFPFRREISKIVNPVTCIGGVSWVVDDPHIFSFRNIGWQYIKTRKIVDHGHVEEAVPPFNRDQLRFNRFAILWFNLGR